MTNNKQSSVEWLYDKLFNCELNIFEWQKPLELPHQETIVGTNTIQTKPFDNQKEMSNNKQRR